LYSVNPSGALFLTDKTSSGLAEDVEFEGVCGGSYVVVAKQKGYCRGQEHWQLLASPVFQLSGPDAIVALNDHHLKGGGLTLRLKVACLRLKPLEIFPAESRLKARSAL
jgi:hypothetical protein